MSEVHFLDLCAIEEDFIYVAAQLDDINPRGISFARMYTYRETDNTWYYHDVTMNIVSVTVKLNHANDTEDRRLAALSDEGEVDLFAKGDYIWRTEKIPKAGVRLGNRGRMNHIRQIGAHLFACGQNGQVYQRMGHDDWRAIDEGIYKSIDYIGSGSDIQARMNNIMDAMANQLVLNCIDGSHERDIYVVGDSGYMAHYDGTGWKRIDLPTDEHLQWVRCYGPKEVWVCGYNGILLKGNMYEGFRDQSSIDDNDTWWCLAKYGQDIYLSAAAGLYFFSPSSRKIERVRTDLEPELNDTYRVDVKGNALWSMGEKDIIRFYKGKWKRIHHIDNEPIRE